MARHIYYKEYDHIRPSVVEWLASMQVYMIILILYNSIFFRKENILISQLLHNIIVWCYYNNILKKYGFLWFFFQFM